MMDGFLKFHLFLRELGYLLVRKPSIVKQMVCSL